VFEGVRVIDAGTWVMVPAASVMLADFGADVVKVEHPRTGDPSRGLTTGGVSPKRGSVDLMVEQTNRGKRSIGLDFATPEGREVLYKLVESADVFLTSFLPPARQKLLIDVEHIRARNPRIIYARADAVGPNGPEGGKPGYDAAVFFGRAGILNSFTRPTEHLAQPRPGFGDKTASMAIAFGVASALFKRERTGEPSVVDASLFSAGMWVASSDIVYSGALGRDFSRVERPATNPIATSYQTADGRWIMLSMLESTRWWPDFCRHIGREDLMTDPRFADAASRSANSEVCVGQIQATFATATLEEWRARLTSLRAPWEVVQTSFEVYDDPQAEANGYIARIDHPSGETFKVVRTPVQFDGAVPEVGYAPEAGQHTEEILLELGYSWEDIARLQDAGAVP
jgi:crotonobetainyl-CoA:carnitine CoA-transferase CaiB-like acyl-CoA transferase